jgi:bacterial/archaeal transporter family-2 protein
MSRSIALVCTAAAGLLVGLQPASNAALSEHVGELGAAFVSLLIGTAIIGVLLLVAGDPGRLTGVTGIRPGNLVGALGTAAVVAIGVAAVRPLGAGAVISVLVAGQVIMSIVADRLGWFGLHQVPIGAGRLLGLALIIAGTVLVTRS